MNDDKNPPPPRPDGEETAHYDDAVIGRAFRWSIAVLILLAFGAGGLFFYFKRTGPPPPPKMTHLVAPIQAQQTAAEVPTVKFTDITTGAGIHFSHNNGAYGDKLLPETMGSGVAFFDFNNDGHQDLLLINANYWPGHVPSGKNPTTCGLYQNDGHGNFTDVTAGSGLDVPIYGMGVAIGDYDNDGLEDVFISGVYENHLFHNLDHGKFKDVTAESGIPTSSKEWGTACAWIDVNNDGKLDLFVGHYVRWSKEIDFEVGYKLVGVGRAYGQPMNFEGSFPSLYRNDGNGHFTDISAASGLQMKNAATGVPTAKTLGIAPVDVDGDGWIDLVIANDTVQNFLFHNERNGAFKEIGALSGLAFDNYGVTRGAMGIDAARFRNDDTLGIAIGNFANEMTALYVSPSGSAIFSDEAITEGLGPPSRLLLKFGIFFFDYDLDGRLDVLTANGHLEEDINKVQQSQHYMQPAQLFWNCGPDKKTTFMSVPEQKAGADLFKPIVGRGSAYADIDGDGDLDVILTQTGGPPLLLRNDQQLHHNWIRLKLIGTKCNRDAIGAWVKARVGSQIIQRQVMPTRSYLSQSELPITIGLGDAAQVDDLEIRWPDGSIQKAAPPKIDALTTIEQPR